PANTTRIKVGETEAVFRHGAAQQLGNDEAGDNKEHVDADKTTANAGHLVVIENYQHDGQCAQPLDVCANMGVALQDISSWLPATSCSGRKRHCRQNMRVNNTRMVKTSRRPSSIAADMIHLAVSPIWPKPDATPAIPTPRLFSEAATVDVAVVSSIPVAASISVNNTASMV